MMMPCLDGYENCSDNKKKTKQNLPIIAMAAAKKNDDRKKKMCIQAGASDYITKPVDGINYCPTSCVVVR
jgi:CheY-like chemotaxis protein